MPFSRVVAAVVVAFALPAGAQSLQTGVELYQQRSYHRAATSLFDTIQRSDSRDERDRAQLYLAETLRQKQLYVAALSYYATVLRDGTKSPLYLDAVEGLLSVQESLHDPFLVPTLLTRLSEEGGKPFAQLSAAQRAQASYLVGEALQRQHKNDQAVSHLLAVDETSPLYAKAQYLLGVIATRNAQPARAQDLFLLSLRAIDDNPDSADRTNVRNVALLALARTQYASKDFEAAAASYARVDRYSDSWFSALSENGWAHFQKADYGKVLGDVQALASPFFAKHHRPEPFILAATTYFVNCQWDRVRDVVDRYKSVYEPLAASLDSYLKGTRAADAWVRDVMASEENAPRGAKVTTLAPELARQVRNTRRFHDLAFLLQHARWEREEVSRIDEWHNTRFGDTLRATLAQYQDKIEPAVAGWVRSQLGNTLVTLQSFNSQMSIVDFEVTDAERRWLEAGREILKGRRARLPRPNIPGDGWQHWSFAHEVWKDELGYYQYALRTECE